MDPHAAPERPRRAVLLGPSPPHPIRNVTADGAAAPVEGMIAASMNGGAMNDSTDLPAAPHEQIFNLDLGDNVGLSVPSSFPELKRWIQVEIDFLEPLAQVSVSEVGAYIHAVRDGLHSARGYAEAAEASSAAGKLHRAAEQLASCQETLAKVFGEAAAPHSSGITAERVMQVLRHVNERAAAAFLVARCAPFNSAYSVNWGRTDIAMGADLGIRERLASAGLSVDSKAAGLEATLSRLIEEQRSALGGLVARANRLQQRFESADESQQKLVDLQGAEFQAAQAKRDAAFQEQRVSHAAEMAGLRKAYESAIALRAPVKYWAGKRRLHEFQANRLGKFTFMGMGVTVVVLALVAHHLFEGTLRGVWPQPWQITTFASATVFAVWALRLLARSYLSHLHLATDAAERHVMVQTYLSLLEGNHLPGDAEKQLIVQTLFRPTSDGYVKDEGLPLSLLEAISRQPKP